MCSHATRQAASSEEAQKFRQQLDVNVDEQKVDLSWTERLDQLPYRYRGVFVESEQELGCVTGVEDEIHLTSNVPNRLLDYTIDILHLRV